MFLISVAMLVPQARFFRGTAIGVLANEKAGCREDMLMENGLERLYHIFTTINPDV